MFPVIAMVALRVGARWRWGTAAVLGGGVLASLLLGVIASVGAAGPDRLYFRTDIRAGELLVGALAGLWWTNRDHSLPPAMAKVVRTIGPVAVALMIGLIATSDYRDIGWYRGGLIAYSLVSIAVILAAVEPSGLVRRALAARPLVRVGVLSYNAYIIHWPLFMWLSTRADLPDPARLAVGTVAALALAELAFRFVESPIRHGRDLAPRVLLGGGAVVSVIALVVASVAPGLAIRDDEGLEEAANTLEEHLAHTAAAVGEAPTIGIFGDSTALVMSIGVAIFDDEDTTVRLGPGSAGLGCTLTVPATYLHQGTRVDSSAECVDWLEGWTFASDVGDLDAAVLMFGPWEVKEMQPDGFGEPGVIGTPEIDGLIEERLEAGIEALVHTPVIVVLTSPRIEPGRVDGRSPAAQEPDADPGRMDRLNEIVLDVASRHSKVAVVDYADWLHSTGDDARLRPDGVHLTNETATEVAAPLTATIAHVIAVAEGSTDAGDTQSPMPVLQKATADRS